MPFLDILTHLGAGAYIGGSLIKDSLERKENMNMAAMSKKFQKMYTDPALEAELKAKIEDSECYDWVWERLEAYKRNRGKFYLWRHSDYYWKSVGHKRMTFFINGSLYGKTQSDADWLRRNRACALWLLIQTYGRMTQRDAKNLMIHTSYNDMRQYLSQHPADRYLNDTHTALDEAPLRLMDMKGGWPEDRRPPNKVSD